MQMQQFLDGFLKAHSSDRLAGYGSDGATREEVLIRYLWNTALGESLYPALQSLEVVLRNSIHFTAAEAFGTATWYENYLIPRESSAIGEAKERLATRKKPITPGRVVAELHFGFWTSLFSKSYEQVLWPQLIEDAFPNLPRRLRTRKTLASRFNGIRELRNRVFHHEPIWHYGNLPKRYEDIVDALGWMSSEATAALGTLSRFPDVHTSGPDALREKTETLTQGD